MSREPVEARVERWIRDHELIRPGGEVVCLVSGGADSTCLWHVLRALGYLVRAVHVDHGQRGGESAADARFCEEHFGARVIRRCTTVSQDSTEAALRRIRYEATRGLGLRATGHTASDQVESVLLGLVGSGMPQRIKPRREDGVVRPLLTVWREETETYCERHELPFRTDATNPGTKRGLIRNEILPLLERLDPRARTSLLRLAETPRRLPRALEASLVALLSSREGTRSADLGGGVRAVRVYDELRLEGAVTWGPWTLETDREGLVVRSRRPGDRLAGRSRKVSDVLVDAKVPRGDRDAWPLVATQDGTVVAVAGLEDAPGFEGVVRAWREST